MTAQAQVEHQMNGRVRLRIPSRRRDSAYFSRLKDRLSEQEGVESVEANPMTGSLLVRHRNNLDTLLGYAADHDLFVIEKQQDKPVTSLADGLAIQAGRLDGAIRRVSGGGLNMRDVALAGVIVAGVVQIAKAHVWPAGFSLFWYAVNLLPKVNPPED